MNTPTLKKIARILNPGPLQEKHAEICLFMASGESLMYSGDIAWKLTIPSADQVVKGDAENMDEAFGQIKGVMEEIMKTVGPAAKVALAVKEKQP